MGFSYIQKDKCRITRCECFQLLIALKSSAHQSITHIEGFRATQFRLS